MCSGCGFVYFNAEPLLTGELIFGFKQETGELTFDFIQETNTTYRVLDHQERWSMKLYVLDSIRVRCEPKFLNVNSHGSYLASLYSTRTLTRLVNIFK